MVLQRLQYINRFLHKSCTPGVSITNFFGKKHINSEVTNSFIVHWCANSVITCKIRKWQIFCPFIVEPSQLQCSSKESKGSHRLNLRTRNLCFLETEQRQCGRKLAKACAVNCGEIYDFMDILCTEPQEWLENQHIHFHEVFNGYKPATYHTIIAHINL